MSNIFPPELLPYVIGIWVLGAVAGPISTIYSPIYVLTILIFVCITPSPSECITDYCQLCCRVVSQLKLMVGAS